MEKIKQVEAVKKALDLEVFVSKTQAEYKSVSSEKFKSAPPAPQREVFTAKYPKPKSELKFIEFLKKTETWLWIVAAVTFMLGGPLLLIAYRFYQFVNYKKEDKLRIQNSDEYKAQCAEIDKEIAEKQAQADAVFNEKMAEYDNVIMPQYKEELNAWKENHNSKINKLSSDLEEARTELLNHYDATKVVPIQYRSIDALRYIYNMISSSDYDVKQAIENYDRQKQRQLEEARLREQQIANEIAEEQAQLLDEQAYLLEKQNDIARKSRRDSNIAAVVGTVQRHNTNKYLKK